MEHVYKDKCRIKIVEFEVRKIDEFGDCQDVNHFESLALALDYAKTLGTWVIEKHTSKRPAHLFGEPDKFEVMACAGNKEALINWGGEDCLKKYLTV